MKTAIVIGGGFYGCCLALYLRAAGTKVTLLEQEPTLLTRASLINQARVHYGYHYPRSFVTAIRSAANFPRFALDFRHAIMSDFTKIYAIAKENSKVDANQFCMFCKKIGAPVADSQKQYAHLFEPGMTDGIFTVKEFSFDAVKLREALLARLTKVNIDIHFNTAAKKISTKNNHLQVETNNTTAAAATLEADEVFLATYSQINTLLRDSDLPPLPMKHEITEVALVRHAPPLNKMGITVMDGPFFSTMPFPSRQAHSFTHVRYTPQGNWDDTQTPANPLKVLRDLDKKTSYPQMIKDARRFIPALDASTYIDSLHEIKTVLLQNEDNDGRPILFRRDYSGLKGLSVVMGGKIDNIYDIFSALSSLRDEAKKSELEGTSWISKILRGD
jgi:glycine/D-amino acid oxidase-like deaminating enzyme